MKLTPKILEEIHPPYAEAKDGINRNNALSIKLKAETAIAVERVQSNRPGLGNEEENKIRHLLGQERLPEILPDHKLIDSNRVKLDELATAMYSGIAIAQREKDVASTKLCAQVASEHTALVKDVSSKLSALNASHIRYIEFLDSLEDVGVSTTSLRPVWPNGIGHPRDASGAYHWAFKEMRESGHISMKEIPEAVR